MRLTKREIESAVATAFANTGLTRQPPRRPAAKTRKTKAETRLAKALRIDRERKLVAQLKAERTKQNPVGMVPAPTLTEQIYTARRGAQPVG